MHSLFIDRALPASAVKHEVAIEFLYLDLETCARCRGTDANLETALAQARQVLDAADIDVSVRKTLVASAEQARALGFVSSPTIRVNGRDVAIELRESTCDECGEACGCDGKVDCRVWLWQGEEHSAAPPALIVDAILREVYGGAQHPFPAAPPAALPENLERYFAGKAHLAAETTGCCSLAKQASCCEPSQKASCCGESSSGGCGCQ